MMINATTNTITANTSRQDFDSRANDLINQVAGMIAARLQSSDPVTQSEGKKMLAACPLADGEVKRLMGMEWGW